MLNRTFARRRSVAAVSAENRRSHIVPFRVDRLGAGQAKVLLNSTHQSVHQFFYALVFQHHFHEQLMTFWRADCLPRADDRPAAFCLMVFDDRQ